MEGPKGFGNAALIALYVLFTLAGLGMIAAGEGAERMAGVASVLLFGVGGGAYVMSKRRNPAVAVRAETITWDKRPVRALVLPVRRAKWLPMLVGQLGMGTALVLMGVYAETFATASRGPGFIRFVGYGGGAFFLFIAAVTLLNLRSGPPRLALFSEGVAMIGGMAASYIPWEAVANVGRFDMALRDMGQRFAGIRATDPSQVRRSASSKAVTVGSRSMLGWDLTYPESMFDLTADELVLLLGSLWQRPELRRLAETLPDGHVPFAQLAERHMGVQLRPASPQPSH